MALGISPGERVAVFIDGANLYSATKSLDFDIDYRKLLEVFRGSGRLIRINYYTAIMDDHDYSPIRPLIDWLDYNGYSMVTKHAKEFTNAQGRRKIKGNMDIELAVDLMEIMDRIDHAFIFSGDGDFSSLLKAVQRKGVRVTIISTTQTNPPMIADELRRQADQFVELSALADLIARPMRDHSNDDPGHDHHHDLSQNN
ncbi:MAG: NYN domain-containing protein [Pseudomonadota bacterium]